MNLDYTRSAMKEHGTAVAEVKERTLVRKSSRTESSIRWEAVDVKEYKEEGTHFRRITRQLLFGEQGGLTTEVRYFEIAPGGHSTFERHEHVHAVIAVHGRGRLITDEAVHTIQPFDLVNIPPMTWHQFQAEEEAPLGFVCLVPCARDRPIRPNEQEASELRAHPHIGPVVRL